MNTSPDPIVVPRRILVVTLADLGDALLTVPALRTLRSAHPNGHISLLTTPVGAAALRDLPLYDDVIVFEKQRFNSPRALLHPANLRYAGQLWRRLRREPFDVCIVLHHLTTWFGTLKYAALAAASGATRRYGLDNGRGFFLTDRVRDDGFGAVHQADYWLKVVGLLDGDAWERGNVGTWERGNIGDADQLLASSNQGTRLIALHPGSGAFAPARRWPPQRFAALADALIEAGYQIVLVGGPEEAELRRVVLSAMRHAREVIDLGGRTSLPTLGAVLQHCILLIGNDSGIVHLASSVGTPVVAIYGPTDPRAWGPYAGQPWQIRGNFPNGVDVFHSGPHRALKAAITCSPCIYRGQHLGDPNGCPDRTCLQRISVEQVLTVVRERLHELSDRPCALTT